MTSPLIDTHAHLDDARFDGERADVLRRASEVGVQRVLTVGISRESSLAAVNLARQFPTVRAAVGIHPNSAAEAAPTDWDDIVRLTQDANVVAVGETGLDRHWDFTPFPLQIDYFARHLELARRTGLPLIIHSRDCDEDMLRFLQEEYDRRGLLRGVMHSFSSHITQAEAYLAMGLHISFAGMVTYKSAEPLRQVAAQIPEDRLLIETDCPYLAPVPVRGQRNEPAYVRHTAECLAQVRQIPLNELAELTTRNAQRLFTRL
jgi:TatD DNase family protein